MFNNQRKTLGQELCEAKGLSQIYGGTKHYVRWSELSDHEKQAWEIAAVFRMFPELSK